jgi:hypothetical protein
MRSGVKRTGLFASLGLTLLAVISLAVWLGPTASDNPAEANHSLVVGIDTNVSGNSALSLGTLEACRVIGFGTTIDVDVYVQGLDDITSFDAYIKYDTSKLIINSPGSSSQGQNSRFMLQQAQPTPPGNSFTNLSEALPDTSTPGEYFIGGYDSVSVPGTEDPDPAGHTHKDGVLVRMNVTGKPGLGGYTTFQISPHGPGNGLGFHIAESDGSHAGDGADSDVFVDTVINGSFVVGSGTCTDSDGDGVPDSNDNCQTVSNPNQENFDGDSQGDACDIDDDNDGLVDTSEPGLGSCTSGQGGRLDPDCDNDNVSDGTNDPDSGGPIVAGPDNCITTANTNQLNTDGDSQGDACDPDDDNDTVLDGADNCPVTPNSTQTNTDGDSMGNACDDEDDGDGFKDTSEAWVGTNSLDNCGSHTTTPPIYSQAWPADLYSGSSFDPTENKVTIADLNTFLAPRKLNTSPGDPNYNVRWDIAPGPGIFTDDINIQDFSLLLTVRPDMFGGTVYAFNGPFCTP